MDFFAMFGTRIEKNCSADASILTENVPLSAKIEASAFTIFSRLL